MCVMYQNLFADYLFAHNVPRVLDELVNEVMQDMPDDPYAKLVRPHPPPVSVAWLCRQADAHLVQSFLRPSAV